MSEHEIDLEKKFPDMKPIGKAPGMGTLNGFGFSLFGKRDYDEETYTYVKTYGLCALFIPIFALSAYRVADAEEGWYFIGKVPLSTLSKAWNCCLVSGIGLAITLVMWNSHISSPEYVAGKKIEQADQLATEGDVAKASKLYYEVATGSTDHREQAAKQLSAMLSGPVQEASAEEANAVFVIACKLQRRDDDFGDVVQPYQPAVKLASRLAESDASGALQLLDTVALLAKDPNSLDQQRLPLLQRLVAQQPDDPNLAGALAAIHESRGEDKKCIDLLTPHRDRLGTTEGARVLGQIFARQGKYEESYALLLPYCEVRLDKLHAAEKSYERLYEQISSRIFKKLNDGKAPDSFYKKYEKAGKVKQNEMVGEYVQNRIKGNEKLLSAREKLRASMEVVPVALDLGIVLLQRGQRLNDPAARRAELEKAEKTFLAIQGVAGESDTYRLSMGQVYYWLGRHDDGTKMFDDLLKANSRNGETLLKVAQTMREIGDQSKARKLAEEAYKASNVQQERQAAASMRTLTATDLDDRIKWIRRCDQSQSYVKAALSEALGNQALRAKNDDKAAKHFREAIAEYARQEKSATSLNNGALAYLSLFGVSRDSADFQQAVAMLENAVRLQPDDSILLGNTASTILSGALTDVIGDSLDLKLLGQSGSISMLGYLYDSQSQRKSWADRVTQHQGVRKSLEMNSKVLILAPKNVNAYLATYSVHSFARDLQQLRRLIEHGKAANFDQSDSDQKILDFLAGKDEKKNRGEFLKSLQRGEETLRAARTKKGATLAYAAATLADQKRDAARMGIEVDADEIVSLSEEAHQAAPSQSTRNELVNSLLFRTDRTVAKKNKSYRAMVDRCRRSVTSGYRVATALARDDSSRADLLANTDFKRALQLIKESGEKSPDYHGAWHWALFRHADPAKAEKIAQQMKTSEYAQLSRDVTRLFTSINGNAALSTLWEGQALGDETEGRAALDRCKAKGVPLPFDGK